MEGGEGPVAALAATGEEKCCTVGQAVLAAGLRLHAGRTRVVAVGFGEAAGDPEGAVHVDDLVSCVAALGATPQDEDTSGRVRRTDPPSSSWSRRARPATPRGSTQCSGWPRAIPRGSRCCSPVQGRVRSRR